MIYRVTLFVTNRKDHAILERYCKEDGFCFEKNEDDEFNIDLTILPENFMGAITPWIER